MGRLGQIVGLLLLLAGLGLAAWGIPYYMLDWGGALVMSGAVLASAGLICFLIGTVLIRLAILRKDLLALRAIQAVGEPMAEAPVTVPVATTAASDGVAPEPPVSSGPDSKALQTAAVAGVAAGGLALTAKSILGQVNAPQEAEVVESPPPLAMTAPEALIPPDETPAPEMADMAALPPTENPDGEDVDGSDLSEEDRGSLDGLLREIERGPDIKEPQIDLSMERDALGLDQEEFADAAPSSPQTDAMFAKVDDALRNLKVDEPAAMAEMTPLDPSPVDQEAPRPSPLDQIFDDLRADLRAVPSEMDDLAPDETEVSVVVPPEAAAASDPDEDHAVDDPASSDPIVSDEGVVAAYNVGDSSYAMFADGRIRVTSPDGQHVFTSMDELKLYMAERRTRALSASP